MTQKSEQTDRPLSPEVATEYQRLVASGAPAGGVTRARAEGNVRQAAADAAEAEAKANAPAKKTPTSLPGSAPKSPNVTRGAGPQPFSFWAVVVIALVIGGVAVARGHWTPSLAFALVIFVLLGALWPPLGIVIGLPAVFYVVFVHGQQLFGGLTAKIQSGPTATGPPGGAKP